MYSSVLRSSLCKLIKNSKTKGDWVLLKSFLILKQPSPSTNPDNHSENSLSFKFFSLTFSLFSSTYKSEEKEKRGGREVEYNLYFWDAIELVDK